jgi:hypothetical protein
VPKFLRALRIRSEYYPFLVRAAGYSSSFQTYDQTDANKDQADLSKDT